MSSNTIYVGRPSKWGNPYPVANDSTRLITLQVYRGYLKRKLTQDPHFLDPLKGKDLACWCPIDIACHADILLEFLDKGN